MQLIFLERKKLEREKLNKRYEKRVHFGTANTAASLYEGKKNGRNYKKRKKIYLYSFRLVIWNILEIKLKVKLYQTFKKHQLSKSKHEITEKMYKIS